MNYKMTFLIDTDSIKEYYNSRAPLETTYPNGQCLYDKTVRSCWCTEVVEEEQYKSIPINLTPSEGI